MFSSYIDKEPKDNRMALTNLVSKLITSGPAGMSTLRRYLANY